MSDTDDTDLLLLIPPDFFLVHTPDFGSDCDINFSFDRDEVKDSIVSDLITQVNDLESRICMIENLDRSVTCCSSHIEDSFINQQSVNSLTESDILRAHIESKTKHLALFSNDNRMLESADGIENGSKPLIERHLADSKPIHDNLLISNANQQSLNIVGIKRTSNNIENQDLGLLVQESEKKSDAQCHNNDRKELIDEIDNFLEIKSKAYFQQIDLDNSRNEPAHLSYYNDSDLQYNSLRPELKSDDHKLYYNGNDQKYSLALPEVFELLKEMEESQHEIEKKLKYHESNFQSEKANIAKLPLNNSENRLLSSQMLDLAELHSDRSTTNSLGLINNKQTENIHERLKSIAESKYHSPDRHRLGNSLNKQVGNLFKPNECDESSQKTDPKSLSLNCSPADVIITNFPPKNGRSPLSHVANRKELPEKCSSFKRSLNFEDIDSSHSQIKPTSKPYLIHEVKNISSDIHNKNGKLSGTFTSSSTCRQSVNLDGKHNYLTSQITKVNGGNHNEIGNTENNPTRNTVLQHKISSTNLLSLSELWNKEPSFHSEDPNKLRQKLEEEKYRRQHCEQQIQALQVRVLEEQERLAVAVQVDQEKDKAILQITESWKKLNSHWNELEEQRHSLAQQLQKEKESSKAKTDELMKKVERWEKEVSQALDLAAGYKEKSEAVQKQMDLIKKNTDEKLEEANSQLLCLNKENEKILQENNNLLDQLDVYRKRIEEEEKLLSKLKVEFEKCKKKCSEYEAEINVLKEQKKSLTDKIKDEKGRSGILEQQKNALQQAVNEATNREKAAQDEARVSNERIEVARTELRALYQGQLEAVVKEKLQEFQCQLEAAEAALKAELQSKEKQWMEKANDQCKQLQERYKMESYQREESYRNEISKWRLRLMESEKLRSASESKLQEEASRRADIAHRLHSVMETQWREALSIISNPLQNPYQAKEENGSKWTPNLQTSEGLKASQSNSSTSMSQADEVPFCKEGLVTSRTAQPHQEHQLKKYIQMLLERGPGNPVLPNDSLHESLDQTFSQDSVLGSRYMLENPKKSDVLERFGHSSKPPWK